MASLSPAEMQQQLAFEAELRPGQRVQATAPMEEGGSIRFTATVKRVFADSVVVTALEPFRLLADVSEEMIIPRFEQPTWSRNHRVQPLPRESQAPA